MNFFATCPKGLEDLLQDEVRQAGATDARVSIGVVYFTADTLCAYRLCLWSRVANRVFLQLLAADNSPPMESDLALYTTVAQLPWEAHLAADTTFAVDFIGTNKAIANTQFGAVRVKDAIVDRMRDVLGVRPNIDKANPNIRVQARLSKGRLQLGLDLSGDSLHQRGYREEQGVAPLKENLAAAILLRAGWPQLAQADAKLIDPMCGSGTFLIEAALMMLDCAPGLFRQHFGFTSWVQFNETEWLGLKVEAQARFDAGRHRITDVRLRGSDVNPRMIRMVRHNLQQAGLSQYIDLDVKPVVEFELPESWQQQTGLVICNPPYGERLGELDSLRETYHELAARVKSQCSGWQLAVFTGNVELAKEMRMRPKRINKFLNGALPCELYLFDILSAETAVLRKDHDVVEESHLSEGALMVANRIRKNQRKLKSWIAKEKIQAYRIYDADLPEYSAAIDLYGDEVHIQEYAAPKQIAADAAQRRLRELVMAAAYVFNKNPKLIALKTRQKNSGKLQYEKLGEKKQFQQVEEGGAKLWVNLWDYLDTGLFLDHRLLRSRVAAAAVGKRFLNLFCYTASATVRAALAGAGDSVSVDMSNTYLDWAARNLELNKINPARHQLVQADCLRWLDMCEEGFDIIMLDPPTFSNSKRMDGVLDVQRDHVSLINQSMAILNPGGTLYFSTNLRGFKLDQSSLSHYQVLDITAQTIDVDYARNTKIHHCFEIRHN